jgi:hypothetical protein
MSRAVGRLTPQHVRSLGEASDALAAAANTIRRVNPQWGPGVMQLLILANDKVVAVMNDGAAAIARYMERHGVKELEAPAAELPPVELSESDQNSPSGDV